MVVRQEAGEAGVPTVTKFIAVAIGWLWAILATFVGLIFLNVGVSVALPLILSAAVALPPIWARWGSSGITPPRALRIVIGVGTIAWAFYLLDSQTVQTAAVAPGPPPFAASDAMRACEPEIKNRLSHPSTADFDWITASTFEAEGHEANTAVLLSAKNSFGLEVRMVGKYFFYDKSITNVIVQEYAG